MLFTVRYRSSMYMVNKGSVYLETSIIRTAFFDVKNVFALGQYWQKLFARWIKVLPKARLWMPEPHKYLLSSKLETAVLFCWIILSMLFLDRIVLIFDFILAVWEMQARNFSNWILLRYAFTMPLHFTFVSFPFGVWTSITYAFERMPTYRCRVFPASSSFKYLKEKISF